MGDGSVEKTLLIFLARLTKDVDIKVTEHLGHRWFDWHPPHRIQEKAIDPLLHALEAHMVDDSAT